MDDFETIMLSGDVLKTDANLNSFVFTLLLDSTLIMEPMGIGNEWMLCEYRLRNDSLINMQRSFLREGNGPCEFNVWSSNYDRKNRRLYFLENSGVMSHAASVSTDAIENLYDISTWQQIGRLSQIKNFNGRTGFVPLADGRLLVVGAGFGSPNYLSLVNYETLDVKPLDFWPNDGFKGDNGIKQNVYMNNSLLYRNYKTNRLLYVCGLGKYMKLFELEGDSIVFEKDIMDTFPLYTVQSDGLNYGYGEGCEQGFYTYTTDSLIYVRSTEYVASKTKPFWKTTYKGYPYNYSDRLWVFNWDGELVRKYQLDTPFYDFIVDAGDRVLYVTTEDMDTQEVLMKRYLLE